MKELYPYQKEAVERVWNELFENDTRSTAIVMPTGSGKTYVMAALAERWISEAPRLGLPPGVLGVAHRTELLDHMIEDFRDTGTNVRVGLVKGNVNQCHAGIVVGSVQTLRHEARRQRIRNVGLILIDECHHAAAKSYRDILAHWGALPDMQGPARTVGVTATLMRGDKLQLGDVFTSVPYALDMRDLIEMGYLVPPVAHHVRIKDLDLSAVPKVKGDYVSSELGEALGESLAPSAVIRAYQEYAEGRPAILFTPTVELATVMADLFRKAGYAADTASSGQIPEWSRFKAPEKHRANAVKEFKAGRINILTNCALFTEGTDLPRIGCVIMMRPTKSPILFMQCLGRGARLDPNDPLKTDFIFLDVVGATQRHTLSANIDLFGKEVDISDKNGEVVEGDGEEEETSPTVSIPKEYVGKDGEIEAYIVDLFQPSRPCWRQTEGGAWFIPLRDRLLAIVPATQRGKLDLLNLGPRIGDSLQIALNITSLADAMRLAELQIDSYAMGRLRNGSKWRALPPNASLLASARTFGIDTPEGVLAGVLHDRIVRLKATRRIDPCTRRRMEAIARYCSA